MFGYRHYLCQSVQDMFPRISEMFYSVMEMNWNRKEYTLWCTVMRMTGAGKQRINEVWRDNIKCETLLKLSRRSHFRKNRFSFKDTGQKEKGTSKIQANKRIRNHILLAFPVDIADSARASIRLNDFIRFPRKFLCHLNKVAYYFVSMS